MCPKLERAKMSNDRGLLNIIWCISKLLGIKTCDKKKVMIWRKYLHIFVDKEKHETSHLAVCIDSIKGSKYSDAQILLLRIYLRQY